MKKKFYTTILFCCVLFLAACGRKEEPDVTAFEAEILEVHEGYFLVEPVEGSQELRSAEKIQVPMKNMDPSPEPQVGDIIEITYHGEIAESYPAQITEVSGIKVVKEAEQWDLIPMVMVNGELYLDTGFESTVQGRCGVMDGEITSTVDGSEQPTENNQSNFGSGYGYQYGASEGTIEIFMNEKWWIFATEEARKELQFPETALGESQWGITLSAENVTPTGLTIVCTQSGGEATGELQTGSWYILEQMTDNGWTEAEWVPQEHDVAWTAEAWIIPKESSVEWEVDWEWLYGELSPGTYRIGKSVVDFRETGNYDTQNFYAEFAITE